MRYRLQRHDGTDCSATMVPITVLRMVPIQRYRQFTQANRRAHMRGTKFCNKVSGIMRQASLHYTQDMKGKSAHIRGAKAILPAL